jgi:hypothetical protein
LRPTRFALLAPLLFGAGLFGAGWLWSAPHGAGAGLAFLSGAVGALLAAVALVLIGSRWLGGRLGLFAGLVWLTSAAAFGGQGNNWLAAASCVAMGLFGTAVVPGRLPTISRAAVGWAFFAVVGLSLLVLGTGAAVAMMATCLAFVLVSQNARSARFFLNPVGLGLLAASIFGRWLAGPLVPKGHETGLLDALVGAGVLPWLPLAGVAMVVGLRQGHHATPFWRLAGCWVLVPVGLMGLGATSPGVALTVATPPLCVLAAAGLVLTITRLGLARSLRRPRRRACP